MDACAFPPKLAPILGSSHCEAVELQCKGAVCFSLVICSYDNNSCNIKLTILLQQAPCSIGSCVSLSWKT
uniref:Uncharacterized protein n=1 Tax=Glycine max TaxID=3847 RepID=C6TM39_SOYBN|nr:unknown [Glycine max]